MRYEKTGPGRSYSSPGRTQTFLGECSAPHHITEQCQAVTLSGWAGVPSVHSMMVCFSELQFA
jgi:hypothetical protein